ncbi:LamG domain-containing protein [Candidatus Nanosalina sp. VS9-1]|uniref:LamG domain-containing protein n=1 Tax=Candidatus Nanosalina sp. VS9-1 TaxID=3388566 RepID=UPI0039E1ADFE
MTLIGYWPLNEASGTTAYDHSGNENHGVVGNSPVLGQSGVLDGKAYDFTGNNGNVDVDPGYFDSSSDFTISFWIYPTDTSANDQRIFDMRGDIALIPNINRSGNGDLEVWINGNENTVSDISENMWQFITVVYTASENNLEIFKDGVSANSFNTDINTSSEDSLMWSGNANYDGGAGDTPIEGRLCECRLYDRPLTENEIQYLYSVGKRGLQTSSIKSS